MRDKTNREGIFVPLKVGDIIYTGRFRNKKTTVKTIINFIKNCLSVCDSLSK